MHAIQPKTQLVDGPSQGDCVHFAPEANDEPIMPLNDSQEL